MGILANNEWREGYLDEGFTSFQTDCSSNHTAAPRDYPGVEAELRLWDVDRWSEPVSMISEEYRDFATYNTMIYEKGALFFAQLPLHRGDDAMRKILRTYYARWRLKHVDEKAFRDVAEEVSHQDLKWFFGQWLHGTPLIDYKFGKVRRKKLPDRRWRTTAVIEPRDDRVMQPAISTGIQPSPRAQITAVRAPAAIGQFLAPYFPELSPINGVPCSHCPKNHFRSWCDTSSATSRNAFSSTCFRRQRA